MVQHQKTSKDSVIGSTELIEVAGIKKGQFLEVVIFLFLRNFGDLGFKYRYGKGRHAGFLSVWAEISILYRGTFKNLGLFGEDSTFFAWRRSDSLPSKVASGD